MSENNSELQQRLNQETQLRLDMQRKHEEEIARLEMHKRLQAEELQLRANLPQNPAQQNQSVVVNNVIQNNVRVGRQSLGIVVRLLYFVFIGSWFGFFWLFFAIACCVSVIGIPIGVLMFSKAKEAFFLW